MKLFCILNRVTTVIALFFYWLPGRQFSLVPYLVVNLIPFHFILRHFMNFVI